MKKIRLLLCAMLVLCFSQGVQAKLGAVYNNVPVYYGTLGATATLRFYLDLLTTTGVYHGEYYQDRSYGVHYGDLPNKSWTGPGNIPAPKITVMSSGDGVVADSYCPGIKEIDPDFDWE